MAFKPIRKKEEKKGARVAKPSQKEQEAKVVLEEEFAYRKGLVAVKDLIAPSAFEVESTYVRVGTKYCRTLFVVGYPRYINVGWFSPIINYASSFDIALFFAPLPTPIVLKQLRDKVGRVEAEISSGQERGKPRDPQAETALRDMESLRDDLTQGIEHFFSIGVYMTLYADSLEKLDKATEDVELLYGSKLIFTKRVLYQAEQGYNSTLPLGNDELAIPFNMNTSPAAAAFPFISSDLTSDNGILYGINRHNNSLILFDRFSLQNANFTVFATSGAGKSLHYAETVLIREKDGRVKRVRIGEYIDSLEQTRTFEPVDEEMKGVLDPGIEVYAFNKEMKGEWSPVSIAARKDAPDILYTFTMKSGREIAVTGDHNMLVLRHGEVVAARSEDVREGEYIPVPRSIPEASHPTADQNVYELLRENQYLYVDGGAYVIKDHYEKLKEKEIDPRYDRSLYAYRDGRRIPLSYFSRIIDRLGLAHADIYPRIRLCSQRTTQEGTSLPPIVTLTSEWMRLFGYIVSEGTIRERYILITNEDQDVRNDIERCLNSIGISYYFRKDGTFVIAGRVVVEYLKNSGIGMRSGDKRVPAFLFNAPRVLVDEFLRAYFEGDGCAEKQAVTATTKSKELASDLCYILLQFGISTRLAKKVKYATNTKAQVRRTYWQLTISGQENTTRFAHHIGFITARKNDRLHGLVGKAGNTNVDTIPVQDVFQELYELFSCQLHGIQDVIDLKNGSYRPSREKLAGVIRTVRECMRHFENLEDEFSMLSHLPHIGSIVALGVQRDTNRELWTEMGHTWRLMKNHAVSPRATSVFKAWSIQTSNTLDLSSIQDIVHRGFRELGISFVDYQKSLRDSLCEKTDMSYSTLRFAAHRVLWQYYHIKNRCLPRVHQLVEKLDRLVVGDLWWDPVVSIKKMPAKDRYVYDLTVDNEVFLAGHGGLFVHNSFAIKLEILRSMMMGTEVMVIDPEREYKHLCEAVGGTYINISLASTSRINPFDLPRPVGEQVSTADIIRSAVITLKGLMRLMLGDFTQEEDSLMDRALLETYAKRDITPQTDLSAGVEPPTLSDLQDVLEGMEGGAGLAGKLRKYTEGTFSGLLNKSTNVETKNQLVVFSVRDLEDELRPIAIYTIVNYIWNVVRSQIKRRILVIDEAWWLMQHEDSARFIFALVKRARKYYLGVTTITQDVNDFLTSEYGRAILTNSALQLLLRQSPAAIELVQKTFLLTEGEKYLLLEGGPGEGIFFAGSKHVAIKVIASYSEDQLITTDPRQLLEIEAAKKEFELEKEQKK